MFNTKLKIDLRIDSISYKAGESISLIFDLAKYFKDVFILTLLYCTLVRLLTEYCTLAWSPSYNVVHSKTLIYKKVSIIYTL